MTNKPKSRRSKNAVNARNDGSALADSSSGLNAHAVTSGQVRISAEGPLANSMSTSPTFDDMHSIVHGTEHQSAAYTDAQSITSGSGLYFAPVSSLGPGDAIDLPTEHVKIFEVPKVKFVLTNKQLKKKARKLKQAQKAKMAPDARSSDESGSSSTPTKAISQSHQLSTPALSDTVAPKTSECSTSLENKVSLATENEQPSMSSAKDRAEDSSSHHCGRLLAQQMEVGQRIELADKAFDALMAELNQQGIAVEAKYTGLMSGIRQWADTRQVPADVHATMPKNISGAATPILQRKFSFIEGKPDIADIRPILLDSSEFLEQRRSKGKIRCVNSSDDTLVDGDTLLDTGNGRNVGADFAEPFWRAEMPERPKQPTPLHEDGESSSHVDADARSSECKQSVNLSHNIAGNERSVQKQEGSSRPSGNGKAPVADFGFGDWNEEDAVEDEEDYSGDGYGEESEDEGISDELAAILQLKSKWLESLVQKKREEMGVLQDRYLSQRGYAKRRGAGRR